jgi:DNA topoisomerase-1
MEQKQASDANGLCSNITDEALAATPDKYASEMGGGELDLPDDGEGSAADAAAMDAEWNESDHPRAENGEFGSGGGGGSASVGLKSHESRESWPEHIKVLKIPPAWKDVRVSDNPDADLLAIGKDTKGRPQYVYSQKFQQSQAALKFARIKSLESDAPMIKDQLSTLTKSNDRKVADHADCANLIFKMGIRPGSDSDTKAKVKAYGATTLEGKHVVTEGDETYLRFTGKKGVAINLHVDDPELASNLRKRAGDAGENGRLFGGVRGGSLLDFVHGELDHGGYKTKDFRTLLANNQASDVIARMPAPKSEKEYKKAVLEVAKQVSAKLGNTPTVALQSYINPAVFGAWRESYAVA